MSDEPYDPSTSGSEYEPGYGTGARVDPSWDAAWRDDAEPDAPGAWYQNPDSWAGAGGADSGTEPAPAPRPAGGLRVVSEAEATARLHIRLPSQPPVPAATLRPKAAWQHVDRAAAGPTGPAHAGGVADQFSYAAHSPARPSALPTELAALTTATMVVPVPSAMPSQGTALLTAALPPDASTLTNAARINDEFTDTIERVFGLDFSRDQGANALVSEAFGDGVEPPSGSRDNEFEYPTSEMAASLAKAYPGRYGVPTQPMLYGGMFDQSTGQLLGDLRYRGAVFHDSSGETAYVDASATGHIPRIRFDGPPVPGYENAGDVWTPTAAAPRPDTAHVDVDAGLFRDEVVGATEIIEPELGDESDLDDEPGYEDGPGAGARRSRRGPLLLAGVAALAAFGVLYGVAVAVAGGMLSGDVPAGVRVLGIDIGGLSRTAAEQRLITAIGPLAHRTVTLDVAGTEFTVPAGAVGLGLDAAGTVDDAISARTNPFTAIPALFGGGHEIPARVTVNGPALAELLESDAKTYDQQVVNGEVRFVDGRPVAVEPRTGRSFDPAAALELIAGGYLDGGSPGGLASVFHLTPALVQPAATAAAVQQAMTTLAPAAVSGPVIVVTGSVRSVVSARQLADQLVIAPDATGAMVPRINGTGLRADLSPSVAGLETAPTDAGFTVTGGVPVLVPGKSGLGFAPARIAAAVEAVVTSTANRVANVPIGTLDPSFTTADAQALGITGVIGTASTATPAGGTAAVDLARAAARVDGTVLSSGAEFDFDQIAGVPGQISGAGASQVSTTVYEAGFYAGLAEGRRTPFTNFEAEYPAGLDASVDAPGTDLTFYNDSGNPVYVYAAVTRSTLTVAMLGRPAYDAVHVATSPRTALVSQGTKAGHGAGCAAAAGEPGFQITVTRTLIRGGQPVATQPFTTVYEPEDGVRCASSPSSRPSATTRSSSPSASSGSGTSSTSQSSSSGGSSGGTSTHPTHSAPAPSATTTGPLGGLLGGL